jgi:hypothetical protein
MKLKTAIPSIAAALLAAAPFASAQNATTDPVGFVTVNITAGTGTSKRLTYFSPPLLEAASIGGQATGTITAITSNSISNSNAGWTPGELSNPATPYVIQITSGAADGRMFLISSSASTAGALAGVANTASTVTVSSVDTTQVDISTLGIITGTDTYKILRCDTIGSLFGNSTDSVVVLGGTSVNTSDSLTISINGNSRNYFFNTSLSKWRCQSPPGDAENVAILPYFGLTFSRLAATPLSLTATGGVPVEQREMSIKNSGITMVSQFWPTETTLSASNLASVVASGANVNEADVLTLTSNGSASNYFFNGTNWRRQSPPGPADSQVIPVGASIRINRKGSAAGYSTLDQPVPYSLN